MSQSIGMDLMQLAMRAPERPERTAERLIAIAATLYLAAGAKPHELKSRLLDAIRAYEFDQDDTGERH